ncbi:MAG TPA: glycoside hydrolase family 9 protein [Puia sp.]|nr:glycoside hydrolase family 9 protein [Puia sp.]
MRIKPLSAFLYFQFVLISLLSGFPCAYAQPGDSPAFYINQAGFDVQGPKRAIIGTPVAWPGTTEFRLIDSASGRTVFQGSLDKAEQIPSWAPGKWFYSADFEKFRQIGIFRLSLTVNHHPWLSPAFRIGSVDLLRRMVSAIIHYYNKQRANTPAEWAADEHLKLFGSDKTVDLRGGWCDASGDVSKYFSHLAYANFMSPQQTPLVTWSLVNAREGLSGLLENWGLADSVEQESLWGVDYMMRALSPEGYFYMIVFSYFNKDPSARRVVGLLANSVTTSDYQAAFREGGGMAIAALARISRWHKNGAFTSAQYLDGAKRAYAHLLVNNTRYDDDGKENIIDEYCALMASTELWLATDSSFYLDQARSWAAKLNNRMTGAGYFIANDSNRPYWHASDAGLPIVALSRYVSAERDPARKALAMKTIKKALDYNLRVTNAVSNPFGYARQSFLFRGSVKDGFFIPHENETGWWWQGEDARLASLSTAALVGGRLVEPTDAGWGIPDSLARYAGDQLAWILGANPYSICFLYGFGTKNVPYMHSNFGHGSETGGISNGITGGKDNPDGSGIDFRTSDEGNEWRWTEQWIPHAAWFLQALTAIAVNQQQIAD